MGVTLALALAVTPVVMVASSASAATLTFTVNSTDWGGADAIPGNGVCATSTGVCTLRAAIEEANVLGASNQVTIDVADTIPVGTKMTGTNPNVGNTGKMNTSALSFQDAYGAIFEAKASMTIDLEHRLVLDTSSSDGNEAAVFYLNGPSINVYNADNVLGSGSSFILGPLANGVVIDGAQNGTRGAVATTANYNPERFVVFREGSQNVTVKGYDVSGFYNSNTEGGIFVFNAYQSPYTPMKNIVIDDVDVLYLPGTTCDGSNGSGCRTRLTNFYGANENDSARISVEGLTFKNMTVRNMIDRYAFRFNGSDTGADGTYSATITDLTIVDNQFLNNNVTGGGEDYAFITLPYGGKLKGTTTISRNVFTTPDGGDVAIYVNAASTPASANSTTASNIVISDNYFDGYTPGDGGVRFYRTGIATFQHNRFGTKSGGSGTSSEETTSGSSMFSNYDNTANQKIRTWYPTSTAKLVTGEVPAGALTVTQEFADPTAPVCDATVAVQRPTASETPRPGEPVTLDVYWTTANDAELYLGSVSGVTGETATLKFSLPVGSQSPDGGETSIMAVNATTGATATGSIRLQTQVEGLAQLQSSQYSRTVALEPGNCKPALTVNQAADQNDETSGRKLHFTVTSTMPLDPTTLTAEDIGLTAEATAYTIDASRINARVMEVKVVEGSGGKKFDVVVWVDDSAKVTATIAAEKVASTAGLTNGSAATFTDNNITFVNPLQVTPPKFTLVTGEPNGKDYSIMIKAGAPTPTADLNFTTAVTQPDGTPALTVDPSTPAIVIAKDATQTGAINVAAAAGDVTANTETTIAHAVTSTDTNYDKLVVPSVRPYLFSTDPTIEVVKTAWVAQEGKTLDPASLQSITDTGTPAPKDSRLSDRQTVCFIYTVSNRSADEWATSLTNVTVTDSDERLGIDGVIGTIGSIPQGQSAELFACTALVPVDTTVADAPVDGE